MDHEYFFNEAAKTAQYSLCLRDKCGAIIVLNNKIIATGYNAPPQDDLRARKCELNLLDSKKPKSDRTCCVHAEWRVIMSAMRTNKNLSESILYFTRVDKNGAILKSGQPYCTVCSRLAHDAGIGFWALWCDTGIKVYDMKTYNDLSYQFHQKNQL